MEFLASYKRVSGTCPMCHQKPQPGESHMSWQGGGLNDPLPWWGCVVKMYVQTPRYLGTINSMEEMK